MVYNFIKIVPIECGIFVNLCTKELKKYMYTIIPYNK